MPEHHNGEDGGRAYLDALVELCHAPLVDLALDGETYPWYGKGALSDVRACDLLVVDLLVVDGPPGTLAARIPLPGAADTR